MKTVLMSLTIAAVLGGTTCQAGEPLAFPEGYRAWTHIKSMVIKPSHPLADPFAGVHHIYANGKALRGYRSGAFEDGAIIAFDLLQVSDTDIDVTESNRKLLGVMEKNRQRYAATGGWGYEGFAGDSRSERLVSDGGQSCHGCHTSQAKNGFVFSRWRP